MNLRNSSLVVLAFMFVVGASPLSGALQDKKDKQSVRQEESENYYKKWLDEDVLYIITEEERAVFKNLSTTEEREQFIEQFWFRRDLDPSTASNEFKEEHYRRIAYANERFTSGLPGWMTDRGRIYIIHGPPDERETHPTGGTYFREAHEGGGSTSTYPFEKWWYRHVEGLGDVELEFVDPTGSGEYRLALNPEEKDALLHVPGAGLTAAEELGLASKSDRPYFSPGNRDNYPLQFNRARDNPFDRYETYAKIQRAKPIKYNDLKELVKIEVGYDNLPVEIREDYFQLNEQQVLVPVTIQVHNKDLTFKPEGDKQVAKLAVYGIVTSLTNRIITEFDDDLLTSISSSELEKGLQTRSMYQKVLPLKGKMRYKLDLIVKDLNSGNIGVIRKALIPPSFAPEKLESSSLILSGFIRTLGEVPKDDQMFVLGDVWVRPSMDKTFPKDGAVGIYMQVYNAALDQTTLTPALTSRFRILKDGQVVREEIDDGGDSIQYFSGRRIVVIRRLDLQGLEPGRYQVQVDIQDRISNQELSREDAFRIEESNTSLASR